jgi:hypothetical protein
MGSRISAGNQTWGTQQNSAVGGWQQRQQGMKDLFAAIKAGDLETAQKAFAGLNLNPNTTNPSSPLAQIGNALASGDMAKAQEQAQAMASRHTGHHHQHVSNDAKQQITNANIPNTSSTSAFLGIGTQINTVA